MIARSNDQIGDHAEALVGRINPVKFGRGGSVTHGIAVEILLDGMQSADEHVCVAD